MHYDELEHPAPRVGVLPAVPVLANVVKRAGEFIRTQVQQQQGQQPAQAWGPPRSPSPYGAPYYAQAPAQFYQPPYGAQPMSYPYSPGYYVGADDYDGYGVIGYDGSDDEWLEGDAELAEADIELAAFELEEAEEAVGAVDPDEIGARRKRRLQRATKRKERLQRRASDAQRKGRPKRAARLQKRLDKVDEVIDRARRPSRKDRGARGLDRPTKGGGRAARRGAQQMSDGTWIGLPPEGELVKIPFRNAGNNYGQGQFAAGAGVREASIDFATDQITFADLELIGFDCTITAQGTAAEILITTEVSQLQAQGNKPAIYDNQVAQLDAETRQAKIFIPSLRDDQKIEQNRRIDSTVVVRQHLTNAAAIDYVVTAQAICRKLRDYDD